MQEPFWTIPKNKRGMPKKYLKYIARQNPKEKERFFGVLECIQNWDLENLDCKTMKGYKKRFRCRVGKFRIVFVQQENGRGAIIDIDTRGDIY